jgi:cytochrome c-type biogenesis protein CcsB
MATTATRLKGVSATPSVPEISNSSALIIIVTLGAAFLTFLGMLNIMKPDAVVTTTIGQRMMQESTMLFASLVFFLAASALYIGFGVSGAEKNVRAGSIYVILGFLAVTGAAGHRWYVAGHPPFANIYEMLLSFVWTVALLTLYAEKHFGVKLIGSVTMPLATVSVSLMHLLPSEVRPLVPALQSTWLHVHVTLAMLSYAACALSFALAMMFLIKDNLKTETFLAVTSSVSTAIYAGIVTTRFHGWGGLNVVGYDLQEKSDIVIQKGVRLFVTIPELGWLFLIAMLASAAPLALYALARYKKQDALLSTANTAVFIAIAIQILTLASFVLRANNSVYAAVEPPDPQFALAPTALAASPFILSGALTGIFASLLYLMLHWRRPGLENVLPSVEVLDRVTYKTIGIAFPLLTLMIAAGAYWANRTWGSYWSWDPKETWAAITWLVYAGYLHMRLTRGWRGRRAAYFAIIGFAVVMFTFFGVTYLLPGLHAYA